MSVPDFLRRKETHFVLWRPDPTVPPPRLIIGRFQSGNPPALTDQQVFDLRPSAGADELWELPAAECGLADGVYHYWFDVTDTNPYRDHRFDGRIACTDPTAWTVDWRLRSPRRGAAAGVVRWAAGQLSPCDPGGETVDWDGDSPLGDLPANNHLVIYELPTTWARRGGGALEGALGTL